MKLEHREKGKLVVEKNKAYRKAGLLKPNLFVFCNKKCLLNHLIMYFPVLVSNIAHLLNTCQFTIIF